MVLDNAIRMEKDVDSISGFCYYQIRNLGLIRKYIKSETCKTLVQSPMISGEDYGNQLLYNILSL